MDWRVGSGYDIHRLVPGRRLVLGGVVIEHDLGLDGHSDADVLAHAVIDALLGAAKLGDIGRLFPPDDERWRGADSIGLLREAAGKVLAAGWEIGNIDATVIAERPLLAPHCPRMEANLADACTLDPGKVSVKATSSEGLGPVGAGEGMAALASALVKRSA